MLVPHSKYYLISGSTMSQTLRAVKPDELAVRKNDFEKFVHTIAHDLRGTVRALTDIPQWLQEDIEAAGLVFTNLG